MRAFHLYIDDYLSSQSIARMDAHEERGYVRLLLRCGTEMDGGLPSNEKELAKTSLLGGQWYRPTKEEEFRFSEEETSGQKLLDCFFYMEDGETRNAATKELVAIDGRIHLDQCLPGRLYNQRFLREFQYQKAVAEKRSEVGKKGAGAKRKKRSETENVSESTVEQTPSEKVTQDTEQEDGKQLLNENEQLLKKEKQTDKQTPKQNTSNDVWVSVSGFFNQKITDLLSGKIAIDLSNPIQTLNVSHDLFLPELIQAATDAGVGFSPAEIREFRNTFWPRWDFAKRRKAVQGILDRHANGEYDVRPPLLKNYLREEHWDRPMRPSEPLSRTVLRIDRKAAATDEFRKRMMQELSEQQNLQEEMRHAS